MLEDWKDSFLVPDVDISLPHDNGLGHRMMVIWFGTQDDGNMVWDTL